MLGLELLIHLIYDSHDAWLFIFLMHNDDGWQVQKRSQNQLWLCTLRGSGHQKVAVILLLCVLIPKTDKYFPTRQSLRNQSMKLLTACSRRPYKDDWKKFDKFR